VTQPGDVAKSIGITELLVQRHCDVQAMSPVFGQTSRGQCGWFEGSSYPPNSHIGVGPFGGCDKRVAGPTPPFKGDFGSATLFVDRTSRCAVNAARLVGALSVSYGLTDCQSGEFLGLSQMQYNILNIPAVA
jgi:hypothetical protein